MNTDEALDDAPVSFMVSKYWVMSTMCITSLAVVRGEAQHVFPQLVHDRLPLPGDGQPGPGYRSRSSPCCAPDPSGAAARPLGHRASAAPLSRQVAASASAASVDATWEVVRAAALERCRWGVDA
jgi:hypothetical protein